LLYFPLFIFMLPPPPRFTLFPYTTLFRSMVALRTMTLSGKVAFVTGGARGIGQAIAIELARSGAGVVFCDICDADLAAGTLSAIDRKSTRLNSSHVSISYAVFCLKKKKMK